MAEGSPPARAAMMVAAALKVDVVKVEVNMMQRENFSPEFVKKNPEHTIPLLEDGDLLLGDSHAIVAYLANAYAKDDALYPKDAKKRAVVDSRLHFDNGTLFARFKNAMRPLFFLGETEISKAKLDEIVEAYSLMEVFLNTNKWVAGDQPSIADYCCITSVGALDMVIPVSNTEFPKLAGWIKRCYSLPFYLELCAPGESKLRDMVESKTKRT